MSDNITIIARNTRSVRNVCRVNRDVEIYYMIGDCGAAIRLVGVLGCPAFENFDEFQLTDYYIVTREAAMLALNKASNDASVEIYDLRYFSEKTLDAVVMILEVVSEKYGKLKNLKVFP